MKYKDGFKQRFGALILFSMVVATLSCQKKSNNGLSVNGMSRIVVSAGVDNFTNGDDISNAKRASSLRVYGGISPDEDVPILDTIITLNDDLLLQATMTTGGSGTTKNANIAAKKADSPLSADIYYKVVVFNDDGSFRAERTYKRGNESAAVPLLLDGGVSYTFVAYSVNSNNQAHLDSLAGSFEGKTLANSNITHSNDLDLLFFKKDMFISSEANNYLTIIFGRQFSQIITSINASDTEYFIEPSVSMSLRVPLSTATVAFSSKNTTRSGTEKMTPLVFSDTTSTTFIMEADPIVFNAVSGQFSISIANLKVGDVAIGTSTTPINIPFNKVLVSGFKYKLNLKIVPQDAYIENHAGRRAVRINGKIWLRHHLGVDYTKNPDVANVAIHGNYYQWGRRAGFTSKYSNHLAGSTPTNFVRTANNVPNAWNLGTDASPVKNTANDQCPPGYRVPTRADYLSLISGSTATFSSTGPASAMNYTGMGVLASKRKKSIIITFPAQGYYDVSTEIPFVIAGLVNRGTGVYAQTSHFSNNNQYDFFFVEDGKIGVSTRPDDNRNTAIGYPIRCVAE